MKKAINHEVMRSNNKRFILEVIRKEGPLSKKEIADRLRVSITSVTTFINELLAEALIVTGGAAKSTGGRKSELFQSNPNAFHVAAIDIQVDRLIILLLNADGAILAKERLDLAATDEWSVAARLKTALESLCDKTQIPVVNLAGLGIGVPGIVNPATNRIDFAPHLGWKNVDLATLLGNDLPPLVMENEANAAAIGETHWGAAQGVGNVIYVSVGIGLGAGLILNRQLYRGPNRLAGEFGHMTIEQNGLPCRCGNRGCWEVYASNEATLRRYAAYSGSKLKDYEELLSLFEKGDPVAKLAMEETVRYLGLGLTNLINGLNPEMIILGGGIVRVQQHIYAELLKNIKERCSEFSFKEVNLRFSELENHAAALGVGCLAIERRLALL
jgi:predicted NBD/HSP70 family sugar kinase